MQGATLEKDPYLWLEEIEGEKPLEWVKEQNRITLEQYEERSLFKEVEKRSLDILDSKEKLAYPQFVGDQVYNFWRDDKNVRGLLRRMSLEAYLQGSEQWEEVLDLDQLADDEDENWVYKGQQVLAPDYERTLLWLSRGGSDACVVREFDLAERSFVEGGFVIPEAKSDIAWKDKDTLYLGTKFDDDSVTDSGYPRVIKVLSRGSSLEEATFLHEVDKEDLAVSTWVMRRPEGRYDFLSRSIDFWNEETYLLKGEELVKLPIPTDAPVRGLFHGQLFLTPRTDWETEATTLPAGSLIAVELEALVNGKAAPTVVYDPKDGGTVESVSCLKDSVLVTITENVQTNLHRFSLEKGSWVRKAIEVRPGGASGLVAASAWRNDLFLIHEDFISPTTLFYLNGEGDLKEVRSLPQRFDSTELQVQQLWATSADGTEVPYYIIHHQKLPPSKDSPALLYGYGGFEVSLLPRYLGLVGANWLERGGIYISANIRGGGEFGPRWHQAALREKRPKAFEDFEAVAADVVERGFTQPKNLAVHGGSNGGLLTGAALTRRPELFGAVVIGVPLLDMRRFHKLLAGASWMAEYGDPDNPDDWAYLSTFSPYQNLKKEKDYPPVLVYTSTKDDRVHPGHARKMVARMREFGHEVDYYENLEGGHAGVSNNKQQAFLTALIYTYLWEKLG